MNIEHSPPKVMFHNKDRPKGHEVPSCARCNNGSGDVDQIAAFVAMSGAPEAVLGARQMSDHEHKVTKGTANNANRVTGDGSPMIYEAADSIPVFDDEGLLIRVAYEVRIKPKVMDKLAKWCAKQALAAWYVQTNKAASHKATISIEIYTAAHLPTEEMENIIRNLGPSYSLAKGKELKIKEFGYKFHLEPDRRAAIMFAQYHGGLGFVAALNDRPTAKLSRTGWPYRFATNGHKGIHAIP